MGAPRKVDLAELHRAGLAVQVEKGGFPASHEVARVLGLNPRTVMRHLDELEEAGLVQRFRTGAKYLDPEGKQAGLRAPSAQRVRTEVGQELLAVLRKYRPDHLRGPLARNLYKEVRELALGLKGEKP